MSTVSVRYIVNDVDAAIPFYCQHLGFHEDMHPDPAFAMLSRGDLRLVARFSHRTRPPWRWIEAHARRHQARTRRLEPIHARSRRPRRHRRDPA